MSTLHHRTKNATAGNKTVRRRSGRSKKKRRLAARIFKWISRNPAKVIGILCVVVIIYLTFLFIQQDKKAHPPHEYYQSP